MAYKIHYSDYPGTDTGPPDPERWVGPPGPVGPVGPQGPQGIQGVAGNPFPEAPSNGPIYGRGGSPVAWTPTLPLSGGILTGALTLAADPATALGAATRQYVDTRGGNAISVPPGGSIQAAHDALPVTGGSILLAANTTYVVTTAVNITKPNVHIAAPSWSTTVQRGAAYTGTLIAATGANCTCEGFTVDGNSIGVGGTWELTVTGDNSLVRNMRFVNSTGTVNLGLGGNHSRATGNTITGPGVNLSTQRGYGIWAISHVTVMIDHNVITGTCIDGIGFDGEGSQCIGNSVSGCHCYTGGQGGQIATYYTPLGGVGNGLVITGNFIGTPGSNQGTGIEAWNPGTMITGNSFDGIPGAAITIFGAGTAVTGNSIRNCGGAADAIVVVGGVTDFVITGNRIADDQTTPTMRYGISVYAGTSDRYTITGNQITGNTGAAIFSQGTGLVRTIADNLGANAVVSGNSTLLGGTQQIGSGTGVASLQLSGALGQARSIDLFTGPVTSGTGHRWSISAANVASEPGGNVGSDLGLYAYTDTGGYIGNPLLISRATGLVTLGSGAGFGGQIGANNSDLSKHITLHTAGYGFGVTASRLNYVVPSAGGHYFTIAGSDRLSVTQTGMGFNGTAAVAKPNVLGACAGNTAIKALLTALAAYGLVTDSTTA